MEKIIKDFLKSDLDESKFFGISANDAIYLDEYLEHLQDADFRFQKMAKLEIESIKTKCPWVNEVWFEGFQNEKTKEFLLTSIHFFSNDGREIYTYIDKNSGVYKSRINVPLIYLLNKGIRLDVKREKDYAKIQGELKEIEEIGHYIYDGKLNSKKSITKIFDNIYRPDSGLYVFCDRDLVVFDRKQISKKHDKPLIKNSNKVLKKILVKE